MLSHPMTRARRVLLIAASLAATAGGVAACGSEGISSSLNDEQHAAAVLFDQRCSGCHTLSVAGTQGSATNVRTREYKDGPNFDQRKVTENCALYAIRNGGFSSGPMPQNIVVGAEAQALARFLAQESGSDVTLPPGATTPPDCPPAG
jgi:mono/diheme cytochrome c family protein